MAGVLTDANLTQIRAAFLRVLPSTATVRRMALTDKTSRGPYVDIATDLPCWLVDASQAAFALIASMLSNATLKQPGARRMLFAYDADVKAGDQVVKNNVVYAVKGEVKTDTDLRFVTLVDVEIVRVEQT